MEINRAVVNQNTSKPIWSPLAVGLFCFFFTFLAAGLMNAISYGRLGYTDKLKKRLLILIPGFIIFIILAFVTPDGWSPLFTAFHLGTILYFRHDQKKLYDDHIANGGQKAGIGIPLLITVPVALIVVISFFVVALLGAYQTGAEQDSPDTTLETAESKPSKADTEAKSDEEQNESKLGDLEVRIGGNVTVEDDRIVVEGESNLLPGSRISSSGVGIGKASFAQGDFMQTAEVAEDGTFHFEFPGRDRDVIITLKLSPMGEASDHYGANLENVTGPHVYRTSTSGTYEVKAEVTTDASRETPYTIPIETPEWDELPEGYGKPNVWMEVDVTSDHKYLYFHGKSNLVEGTWLGGNLMNPPGSFSSIVPFSHDFTHVNPDGSFELKIHYLSLREGMYLPIKFEPDSSSWDNVKEAYGEKGEKLEGELVKTTDEGHQYIEKIVKLDAPELTTPEEVDLTVADEEIKMQVPDDLLFNFDESKLKSEAKATLDEIIKELEELPSGAVIHINGHTDDVGEADYNMELSERRAQSVLDYLQKNGDIGHLNMSTHGFGETKPRQSNEEEEGRSKNRRVEIVINPQ